MKDKYPLLLGGRHVETSDILNVINPFNSEVISSVCRAAHTEAGIAIEAADKAKDVISKMPRMRKPKFPKISLTK